MHWLTVPPWLLCSDIIPICIFSSKNQARKIRLNAWETFDIILLWSHMRAWEGRYILVKFFLFFERLPRRSQPRASIPSRPGVACAQWKTTGANINWCTYLIIIIICFSLYMLYSYACSILKHNTSEHIRTPVINTYVACVLCTILNECTGASLAAGH